jgi:hypothetical protein
MKRLVVAVAGTAALALGVAACGDKPVDAVQVLTQAADKTADASSAKFAADMSMSGGSTSVKVHEAGEIDLSGKRATMRLDASQFGLPGLGGDIEGRFVDGVVYMDFSKFLAKASDVPPGFAGKHWLKLDLSKAVQGSQALGNDPSSFTNSLQYLRAADKDGIEDLGDAKVRGVDTTRYGVDIDLATVREKLAAADVPEATRTFVDKGLDAITDKTMHENVWIDHDGRVRRQDFTMHMLVAGDAFTMHMSMDYFDFGTAVHAEAPPASEVFDASDLLSSATS